MPSDQPRTPSSHGVQTPVWFRKGKKADQEFRSALSLHRENATLSENKENVPPHDVKKADTQHDEPEETGHDAQLHQHH